MTPDETRTRRDPRLMTRGLRVRVDAGTGTGMLKSTRGLPVPLPKGITFHFQCAAHVLSSTL